MTATTVLTKGTLVEVESASSGVYSAINEIQGFSGPGGAAKVIDVTNLQSTAKEKRIGLADEGQFSLDMNFNPADAGQARLYTLRNSQATGAFRVTYSNGVIDTFSGLVLEFTTSGAPDDVLKAKCTIEITGAVTRV